VVMGTIVALVPNRAGGGGGGGGRFWFGADRSSIDDQGAEWNQARAGDASGRPRLIHEEQDANCGWRFVCLRGIDAAGRKAIACRSE